MEPRNTNDQGLTASQQQSGVGATMPLPPSGSMLPQTNSPWHAGNNAQPAMAGGSPWPPLQPPAPVPPVSPEISRHDSVQATVPGNIAGAAANPSEAADNDVIEKEWVVRAKQVVDDTRHDPYNQVRELNKLKAAYMKKRYDKDLKLPDA